MTRITDCDISYPRAAFGGASRACLAFCKRHGSDEAYRMCVRVAVLTGMLKRITDMVNRDGVKEAPQTL